MRRMITTQIARSNGRLQAIVPLDPKEVGRRLAAARQRKHWTQLEFALKIEVSPASVSRWERGYLPPVRELMRIAEVLGIEPAELVEERSEHTALEAADQCAAGDRRRAPSPVKDSPPVTASLGVDERSDSAYDVARNTTGTGPANVR